MRKEASKGLYGKSVPCVIGQINKNGGGSLSRQIRRGGGGGREQGNGAGCAQQERDGHLNALHHLGEEGDIQNGTINAEKGMMQKRGKGARQERSSIEGL